MNNNRCVFCLQIIPEGRQVCPSCEQQHHIEKIGRIMNTETRACWYEGKRALFHRWADEAYTIGQSPMIGGHAAGQMWNVFAVIEFEDGSVKYVSPQKITFADGGNGGFEQPFFANRKDG